MCYILQQNVQRNFIFLASNALSQNIESLIFKEISILVPSLIVVEQWDETYDYPSRGLIGMLVY